MPAPAGEPLARRAPGQRPELSVHVCLIVEAGCQGHLGQQVVRSLKQCERALQAQHARDALRRQPDLLAKQLVAVQPPLKLPRALRPGEAEESARPAHLRRGGPARGRGIDR